ncbi:MAG: Ig-like domain-containing protein [Rhodospirillales bacterium]
MASGALLSVAADGQLVYDPNGRFTGLAVFERATDSFTYTIADGSGATSSAATVTIQVQGVNDAPVASADMARSPMDAAVRIPVLNNDADPDAGNNLRVLEIDSTGSLGSVRINADGTLTWSPGSAFENLADGQQATDTFRYVLDDFVGGRSTGVVTVTVVGRAGAAISSLGEIVQSFEVPSPLGATNYIGSVVETGAVPSPVSSLFRPTHQSAMAVLTAEGNLALEIERHLSLGVGSGGRLLVHLPDDPVNHTSPVNGSAMRTALSLSAATSSMAAPPFPSTGTSSPAKRGRSPPTTTTPCSPLPTARSRGCSPWPMPGAPPAPPMAGAPRSSTSARRLRSLATAACR